MLEIPENVFQEMIAHLRRVYPEEGCGLLGGVNNQVRRIDPIENIAHSNTRYEMDPATQIKTMLSFEKAGLEMLVIYHSHPHSPPYPSATDLAHAFYPDSLYLIVSFQMLDAPEVRVFRIDEEKEKEKEKGKYVEYKEVSFEVVK